MCPFLNSQVAPLFPETNSGFYALMHVFHEIVARNLVHHQTLLEITNEYIDTWTLNPTQLYKEYDKFANSMVTILCVLMALNAHGLVTRFDSSHPFVTSLGRVTKNSK